MRMHEPQPPTLNEHGDEVHPAFGNITVHRSTVSGGPHGGAVLFDSEIAHHEVMRIEVTRASRKRDLNHDWIHSDDKPLIEVEMSMAQWASFVSAINSGGGVPCTIRKTETEWDVPGVEFAPRLAISAKETREAAERAFSQIREARDTYEAKKTAANLRNLHYAIENATSHVTYATETLTKHTENVVQKARADIEGMVVAHAQQLGIDTAQAVKAITPAPASVERTPYVGEGADGARRSARIDREEADCLDPGERRDELLASAERWEQQAAAHEGGALMDFDRLTDTQIAQGARLDAQERLRQAISAHAATPEFGGAYLNDDGSWLHNDDFLRGYAEATSKHVDWLWELYVNGSCVCDMDYGSRCNCDANSSAASALQDILGPHWHDILREAKVTR